MLIFFFDCYIFFIILSLRIEWCIKVFFLVDVIFYFYYYFVFDNILIYMENLDFDNFFFVIQKKEFSISYICICMFVVWFMKIKENLKIF